MFHVKRSREGGDVSRETKEGGVPVFGGGLPSLPPADLAFSLLFCPHPPDPRSQSALPGGKGELFVLFCRGLAPPAPLRLSPGGTGYFLPCQCFLPPSPRPPSRREGGDQGYFMQGAPPLASPGLSPDGIGFFCRISAFCPHPPDPLPPWGRGRFFVFSYARGSALASPGLSPGGTGYAFRTQAHKILSKHPLVRNALVNAYL